MEGLAENLVPDSALLHLCSPSALQGLACEAIQNPLTIVPIVTFHPPSLPSMSELGTQDTALLLTVPK